MLMDFYTLHNFSRYINYTFKMRILQILSGLNQNNKYLNFVALNDFNMFCLIFSNFNPSWSTPRSLLKPPSEPWPSSLETLQ